MAQKTLKSIFRFALAGLFAGGIVLGIGGRLAMRLIAWLGDVPFGFSWGGTLEVVLLGAIIGLITGTLAGLTRSTVFTARPKLSGTLIGSGAFAAMLFLPIEGKEAAKTLPDISTEVFLIFFALFILFGIASVYFVIKFRA